MAAQWNDSQIAGATEEELAVAYKNGKLDALLGRTVSSDEGTDAPAPVTNDEVTRVLAYLQQQGSVSLPTPTPGTDLSIPVAVRD